MNDDVPPRTPLELRHAGATLDVKFPERTIELIAVPYDTETLVPYKGRWVTETVAPGSFDGVERRANRVKVNRDHDVAKTIGRVVALHPSRPEGLVAELRIGKSPLGDETLEYAADGILDASVGFAPFPGHEFWDAARTTRRIDKAFLGHIALVPEPAYEGANVLSVRHVERSPSTPSSATPNLDLVRIWRLEERFAQGGACSDPTTVVR